MVGAEEYTSEGYKLRPTYQRKIYGQDDFDTTMAIKGYGHKPLGFLSDICKPCNMTGTPPKMRGHQIQSCETFAGPSEAVQDLLPRSLDEITSEQDHISPNICPEAYSSELSRKSASTTNELQKPEERF